MLQVCGRYSVSVPAAGPERQSQKQGCAPDDAVALDHAPPLISHMALDGIKGVRPALRGKPSHFCDPQGLRRLWHGETR